MTPCFTVPRMLGHLKAAGDGGDPKAAGDGGDLDREDTPTAEYLDDYADLHHEDAADYINDDDGGSNGVSVPQISSPNRESEIGTGEASTSGLPTWILLDPLSIDGDLGCDNATTAEAQTITWREDGVKISFLVANPPCPSHFKISAPSLIQKPYLLCGRPSILYTVRNLALMSITFDGYPSETEYYLYRVVGPGQRPLLIHLEYVSQQLKKVFHVVKVGLLPGDGDGFVLAALALLQVKGSELYGVYVFQYEQGTWTSKVHVLEHHQVGNIRLYNVEKVIALSVGELGFVDMWNGILVFNVLEENLIPRYIPLPKLLPGNHSDQQFGFSAKQFRDVIFSTAGRIKCVELEMCWKHIVHEKEKPDKQICNKAQEDVWESDMLYDADLMHRQNNGKNNDIEEVEETFEYLGWRFISWSRKPYCAYWRKDCSIQAKDIINSAESQLWGIQLNKLSVSFPTLSMDGSELYIVSKVHATDLESRVIMVDLGKNSIKAFSPFPTKRPDFFQQAYVVCDLFKCMNTPSDESQVYGQKALFPRLPLFKHENIVSVRTKQPMEQSEGAPVGLQLILLDDQALVTYGCWPSYKVDWTI